MAGIRISVWIWLLRAWGLFWSVGCLAVAGVLFLGLFGSDTKPDPESLWHMAAEAQLLTACALTVFALGTAIPGLATLWRGSIGYVLALIVLVSALLVGASLMEASRLTLADAGSAVLAIELALFMARPVRQFILIVE